MGGRVGEWEGRTHDRAVTGVGGGARRGKGVTHRARGIRRASVRMPRPPPARRGVRARRSCGHAPCGGCAALEAVVPDGVDVFLDVRAKVL